jgi:eukaryotic-like serine/threonine-protein kinase
VAQAMIGPLSKCLGTAEGIESRISLSLLASYVADDHSLRTRLCLDAASWQRKWLTPATADLNSAVLWEAVRRSEQAQSPQDSLESRVAQSRRVATAAALLLTITDPDQASELWSLLKRSSSPDVRHQLIHRFAELNVPPPRLISRLRLESDPDITSALLMALGGYPAADPTFSDTVKAFVRDLFRNDPDAAVHSSAEWLLRRWNSLSESDRVPMASRQTRPPEPRRPHQWVQTSEGHTFALIRAQQELGRDLLAATKEVSVAQYQRFNTQKYHNAEFSPSPDCPTNCVTWAQGLAYCNWLSQQDGIPEDQWCYPRDESSQATWTPDTEYFLRTGYRLPLYAEWRFICQTGSRTRAAFGDDLSLMGHYAWFEENARVYDDQAGRYIGHAQPGGLKLPNDWGLFDLYGNVSEWCGDVGEFHANERALGGYALSASAPILANNKTGSFVPTVIFDSIGFRVVRTIKPE